MKEIIVLVDGNNLVYASNFAFSLSTSRGVPTQAIYGFLSSMRSLRTMFSFSKKVRFFVVFDKGKSGFRVNLLGVYKKRKPPNEEFKQKLIQVRAQMPSIQRLASELFFSVNAQLVTESGREVDLVEADDVIAVLAKHFEATTDQEIVIVSSDKDFPQLVSRRIRIFNFLKSLFVTSENFSEVFGFCSPSRYLESRLIIGDTSDRIPGVPGVGEKTIKKVLRQRSLQELFKCDPEKFDWRTKKLFSKEARKIIWRNLQLMKLPPFQVNKEKVVSYSSKIVDPAYRVSVIEEVLSCAEITSFSASYLVSVFKYS